MHGFWTEERTAALVEMHAKGMTVRQIAASLGTTGGAVDGKIERMGLTDGRDGVGSLKDRDRLLEALWLHHGADAERIFTAA